MSLYDLEPWENPWEEYAHPVTSPELERRVAELEAALDRLLHPVLTVDFPHSVLTEDEMRRLEHLRVELRKTLRQPHKLKVLPPLPLEERMAAVEERLTALEERGGSRD